MNVMHLIGTSLPCEGLIGYVVIFRVINFTKNELRVLGMNWERFFLPTIRKCTGFRSQTFKIQFKPVVMSPLPPNNT